MKYQKGDLVWLRGHEGRPGYLMKIKGEKFRATAPPRPGDETVYWVVLLNRHQADGWGECGEDSMVELTALDRIVYI
jgi:hypothetical protein